MPAEADRVFDRAASAFRRAARGGRERRSRPAARTAASYLSLTGINVRFVLTGTGDRALARPYFAERAVVSLQQAEGCTTGDDTRLTRSYRLTTQVGGKTVEGTLTITIHKKKLDARTSAWFLGSLKDV